MDLIRLLLLSSAGEKQDFSNYDSSIVSFHIYLLIDAGFAVGPVSRSASGFIVIAKIQNLTWNGYDFLETIRDSTVWDKTKIACVKAGSFAIPVIQRIAGSIALQGFSDLLKGLP